MAGVRDSCILIASLCRCVSVGVRPGGLGGIV